MARASSIDRLAPELRQRLHELLDRPGVTQQQIADALNAEAGETVTSKSAVNRYAVHMRKFAERNRAATQAVKAYLAHCGAEGQQELSEVLVHQLRTIAFDAVAMMQNLHDQAENDDPSDQAETAERMGKLLAQAARSLRDIEMAADRSIERRRKLKAEIAQEAAEAGVAEARAAGISDATIDAIRKRILGVAA